MQDKFLTPDEQLWQHITYGSFIPTGDYTDAERATLIGVYRDYKRVVLYSSLEQKYNQDAARTIMVTLSNMAKSNSDFAPKAGAMCQALWDAIMARVD